MTYMKPEMEIEKFDLIEEITAGEASATAAAGGDTTGGEGGTVDSGSEVDTASVGSDLIIG